MTYDRGLIRYPATTTMAAATTLFTGTAVAFPGILLALQRQPSALHGEWWRLVTAFLLERGGWVEIGFNLVSLLLVGILAERAFDRRRWLVFYLVGGIVGQLAGLAWKPFGAGTSVALCGLLGAWALHALRTRRVGVCLVIGVLIIGLGIVLTARHNLHGPPILAGACVAALWTMTQGKQPQ
jgi:rhomboid protease GluP